MAEKARANRTPSPAITAAAHTLGLVLPSDEPTTGSDPPSSSLQLNAQRAHNTPISALLKARSGNQGQRQADLAR
jgi:hypothetical protein